MNTKFQDVKEILWTLPEAIALVIKTAIELVLGFAYIVFIAIPTAVLCALLYLSPVIFVIWLIAHM